VLSALAVPDGMACEVPETVSTRAVATRVAGSSSPIEHIAADCRNALDTVRV
jgi:hypothetical protein